MSAFFKRYVRGVESPPYEEAFAQVGLRFVRESGQPVSLGISADESDPANFKVARVRPDSPAADAGLQVGDKVMFFGGLKITPTNFLRLLSRYKPGDHVALIVQRGTRSIQTSITLGEPQSWSYRIEEMKDAPVEVKALRASWLSGK